MDSQELRYLQVLAGCLPCVLARQGALLAIKDAGSGRYEYVNAGMAAFLGRAVTEVLNKTDAELLDPALATTLRAADHTALAQDGALASEHRFEWAQRRHDYLVTRMLSQADADGRRHLCSIWQDQSAALQREAQLKAALEQLEQQQRANDALRRELKDQAQRDATTGLYKRSHFDDQLVREVDLSSREHREFALVLISLDPFSEKLAGFGDAGRTRVYEAMGRLLRGNTRAMDVSCQLDEGLFVVLLSGVGLATAHSRMEGLRRQCASQIVVHEGHELAFSVSMGVASYPHTATSQQELLAACQLAMAEAQRRGGNRLTLASIKFEPS